MGDQKVNNAPKCDYEVDWNHDQIFANKLFIYPLLAIAVTLLIALLLKGQDISKLHAIALGFVSASISSFVAATVVSFIPKEMYLKPNIGIMNRRQKLLFLPYIFGLIFLSLALGLLVYGVSANAGKAFGISIIGLLVYVTVLLKDDRTMLFTNIDISAYKDEEK